MECRDGVGGHEICVVTLGHPFFDIVYHKG